MIAKGLLWLLEFFQKYVNNWGVAIILLTVLIKALFWPLTAKSYASMEKMKKLQPHMVAIREKHKDNKELMNKEVMALYKTYGVNPASGCVPILIQMPVFFGLYQALLTSIELRHAPFITYLPGTDIIWLADLSAKDPFYITPVVMGLTMFIQQKMSPPATDPTQHDVPAADLHRHVPELPLGPRGVLAGQQHPVHCAAEDDGEEVLYIRSEVGRPGGFA